MELVSDLAVLVSTAPAGRERLLTFLTRGHGGVRLYARRQPPGAKASVYFDTLQGGELAFLRSAPGARPRLRSFVPQRAWPGIRADLGRTVHALGFLELLKTMLTEGEPHPESFDLLVRFLNRLEQERLPGLARIAASLRLLVLAGFAPALDACALCRCSVDPPAGVVFSPQAGGAVCRGCAIRERPAALPITPAALGFMQRVLKLPEGSVRRLRVPAPVEREVSRLLDAFVEERTGARPRWGAAIARLEAG